MNFGTILRDPFTGDPIAKIDFSEWLYYEYHQRVNDTGRSQGIFSQFKTPFMINLFDMIGGVAMDRIMETWFKPFAQARLDNSNLQFFLDEQHLVRYDRVEHLNDGRPRDTFIGRTPIHLLKRVRILPPQDPLVAPYAPVAPFRVPPHDVLSVTAPIPLPLGAGVWPLPSSEGYDGSTPPPPAPLVGTSTAHRMAQMVQYAKDNLNLSALLDVTVAVPPDAGLTDHPIDVRYDNLLEQLQKMSAASWHAWFYGVLAPGRLPVDFTLVPDPAAPNKWIFTTKPGGLGVDHTATAVMGGTPDPVVLSSGNDNIIQPVIIRDHIDAFTRIYVGGKATGTARDVIAVQDGDRSAYSPWNVYDHFVHSSKIAAFLFDGSTADGIRDAIERGTSRLKEDGPREEYTLIVRLNRTLRKGVNLSIGDLLTGNLFGSLEDFQVRGMRHVISRSSGISIAIELGQLDGRYFKGADEFRQIINRQEQIKADAEYTGEAD